MPPYNGGYPPPPGGLNFPSPQIPAAGYAPPPAPPVGYSSNPAHGSGGYAPPPGPPGPQGGRYPPPPGPHGGYAPPPGPPRPQGGEYAPPPGPPRPHRGGYTPPPGPQGGGYAPPPGAPGGHSSYAPPPGVPGSNYAPPPGPPGRPGGYAPPLSGPGAGETTRYGAPSPSFAPPSGPPPNSYGTSPPQAQYQGYDPPPSYPGQYPPPSGPPVMPPSQIQYYGGQLQGPNDQMHQPFFQYSQCNGKKKALCIGINYIGQSGQLAGCHNDARNLASFLCRQYGYLMDDIVILTDDSQNPRQVPTRANIISAMQWLVQDAGPNDSLFFHYSGHGGQTEDLDGDEESGFDDVIYPVDFEQSGHIVDDDMFLIMVAPLPPGCRLTAIYDSCHSGTALDLPYVYSTEGKLKEPNLALEAGQGLFSTATSYMKGDISGMLGGATALFNTATGKTKRIQEYARRTRTSPADAICWGGCKDSQTSADTMEAGVATGAMSWAFVQCLSQNPQQSYQQLLVSIRTLLRDKYSQKPQLSCSHPLDTNLLFIA